MYVYLDEVMYVGLFISAITVNKYVLSVIHFTIPTVFQGWQTLVCVLILNVLIKYERFHSEFVSINWKKIHIIIPSSICFLGSIVSGSKALADLPVPIYLATTNIIPAISALFTHKSNEQVSLRICSSITICGSVIIIIITESSLWQHPAPWFWILVHVCLTLGQSWCVIYFKHGLTDISNIYYWNFFSIISLLPISIYLQEAATAYNFPRLYDTEFYLGCILSGIFGVFLQLQHAKIQSRQHYFRVLGIAKFLSILIAWEVFLHDINTVVWCLVLLNLSTATFGLSLIENSARPNTKPFISKIEFQEDII